MVRVRKEICDYPDGRYHCCHAGLMEWVMPVMHQDRLAWILFAGQAKPKGELPQMIKDIRRTQDSIHLPHLRHADELYSESVLESLRQLRARLTLWHEEMQLVFSNPHAPRLPGSRGPASRRLLVQTYLYRHHAHAISVASLAEHLSLSESRTTHLVRELFGCTYVQLLCQMRLRTAASLLRNSSLSVLEICLSSGFQDLSHFHRVFLKRFGMTPLQFRKGSPA